MVALSYAKRRAYEKIRPIFWRYAGSQSETLQAKWFEKLLLNNDYIILTAKNENKLIGFVIGQIIKAPEVYDPGGLTLLIDDFCIERRMPWILIGNSLLRELKKIAKTKGATQILVVCGTHDKPKRKFLESVSLVCASEWFTGRI